MDGDRLVHVQKWNSKETTFVREIKDGKMVTVRLFTAVFSNLFLYKSALLSFQPYDK